MTLTGCVGGGDAPDLYQLREISVQSGMPAGGEPNEPSTPPIGITEGAWVRLQGERTRLERLLGQRVRITGEIVDTGANTIGTAGVWGEETPSGDKSQAASDEHYADKQKKEAGRIARQSMANGRSAEIRVQQVSDLGERCEA